MLVPVCISIDSAQRYSATVPDFPACSASGSELGRTLTRIHLKIEGQVSDLLINGEELPAVSALDEVRGRAEYRLCQCYEIHINLRHLAAVARHQK